MKNLVTQPAVRWLPWSRAAFQRAGEERKIVLLSVSAGWSRACREMDEQCYADRGIAEQINSWCIPVRVDAERRPDVADRYDLGGLPTTAFLNADGEVLGGGTFVSPERLRNALARVSQTPVGVSTPNIQLPTAKVAESRNESTLGVGSWQLGVDEIPALTEMVFRHFDDEHAGFCDAPKFPLVAPVRLALDLFREAPTGRLADYVARTLDAMAWGPLYDDENGGFFRCATRADWSEPQPEKLLVTNAALLDLYLEAGVTMGNQRWLARAADVLEYIQSKLSAGPGEGWRAFEDSDGLRFSDGNALTAGAVMHASQVFEDASLRELALQSLESVLLAGYRPGEGVAHWSGGVRGLLTDQVAMLGALLRAFEITGNVVYRMMGEELAHYMMRTMWDAAGDGFLDRDQSSDEGDVARLRLPLRPFVLNCEAAEALRRLSRATEGFDFSGDASRTLDGRAADAARQGPLAAHYVLARRALR